MAKLIIISGLPATGKTTLAKKLSQELGIPYVSKDELKEALFDHLGWSGKAWSRKLSITCFRLMDYFVERSLSAGQPVIVEANFQAQWDRERLLNHVKKTEATALEIICSCEDKVRQQRFRQRHLSGQRHPGHVDGATPNDNSEKEYRSLNLGENIVVDTTDPLAMDYSTLLNRIQD